MGQKRKNIELVTDFSEDRHFLRLHRDIVLPAEIGEAVRLHLSAGRWDAAKCLALEHAPANAQEEIQLFFDSAAEGITAADEDGRV